MKWIRRDSRAGRKRRRISNRFDTPEAGFARNLIAQGKAAKAFLENHPRGRAGI